MSKIKTFQVTEQGDKLSSWLKMSGMTFDPFVALEASGDPHLSKYLIEHNEFVNLWGNWPNIVLAPPGAGKTAMRIKLTQACFTGGGKNRPFPINYSLPFLSWGNREITFEDHLSEIMHKAGLFLLLYLAYKPHRFFALTEIDRHYVSKVINWILPGPISTYLEPCQRMGNLEYLEQQFPPAILPPSPQEIMDLNDLWEEITRSLKTNIEMPSLVERWEAMVDILIRVLKFPSIYILVDGVDASPQTGANPKLGIMYLNSLLFRITIWSENKIFLKFFLPQDITNYLSRKLKETGEDITPIEIRWPETALAEVIRKRVYVASEGNFGSLEIFASPAISDLEMRISKKIHTIRPLPREMLVFTRQLLITHANGNKPEDQIQPNELEKTFRWYQVNNN